MSSGIVFDIQRGALHDGPGLRTTVFHKGCPLRCRWCHNPESWKSSPEKGYPFQIGDEPKIFGCIMSVEEVMCEVRKDRLYYERSGGGLTLSGGEPTVQWKFCRELLQAARSEGFHTCLDTSGYNQTEVFLDLLPHVNLFLWDYKVTGNDTHKELTGVTQDLILQNFERLYQKGANILLRCPMIPGYNDTSAHFEAIARYATTHPRLTGIEILPYHTIGLSKYDQLGMVRPELSAASPTDEIKASWRAFFQQRGCSNVVVSS